MLQGREPELARVARLLADASEGHGGALVLHGQPGVGKSALLAEVRSRATGAQVLSTQGIESESPLAFAALQRLLQPVLDRAGELPEVQAVAVRAAFGQTAEGGGGDRFLVFLGVLGLLSAAADETPVLCLVDDAHWLDDASAAALQFVARRLERERVAVVFAARADDVRRFDHTGLPVLDVAGLDDAAARALLARAGADVAPAVAARLVRQSGGNPLALLELPGALTPAQLTGAEPLPSNLPLTEELEAAFADRYRQLGPDARTLVLVAAADGSTRLPVVRVAAGELGAETGSAVLDEAERSGLLTVAAGRLEFRHPLVRSAVYQAATSATRSEVHRALAAALTAPDDAERRAWHLAEGTAGPDDVVAAALDDAAGRALRRGGYEAASAAFERAAGLTVEDDARARRLLAAASTAWLGGELGRAGPLATEGRRRTTDPLLAADLDRLRGRVEFHLHSVPSAVRLWTRAARDVAGTDPARALEIAVLASAASTFAPPADRTDLDPAEIPVTAGPGLTDRHRCLAALLVGFHELLGGRLAAAATPFRAAFDAVPDVSDIDLGNALGIAAFHLGDDEAFARTFGSLLGHAREDAAYGVVQFALSRLALAPFCAGRIDDAISHATEARQLAADSGQPGLTAMPLAELALYAAVRGDDRFDAHVAELDEVLAAHRVGVLGVLVSDARRWALGERELVAGRYAEAVHHLEQMVTPPLVHLAGCARLEAAVRADRLDLARAWWHELDGFAAAVDTPQARAAAAYGAALLADGDPDEHFEAALAHHARAERPLEAARTRLAYGESLRRRRQRVAARVHLREAVAAFDDLGVAPWAERARQELRASGETARRRDDAPVAELTPQERQVATYVAAGLSNKDVAAQLFLSPRTIDFHLRNVFAKLGVSSRAELSRLELP